jgi:hypothetical protein
MPAKGLRGIRRCCEATPYETYACRIIGDFEDDVAVVRAPIADVVFNETYRGVEAGDRPLAFPPDFVVNLSGAAGPNSMVGARTWRRDGKPIQLYVPYRAIHSSFDRVEFFYTHLAVIDLASKQIVNPIAEMPEELLEVQSEAGTTAEAQTLMRWAVDITRAKLATVGSSWAVGKEHFMVCSNHPICDVENNDWEIASWKIDGTTGVQKGTGSWLSNTDKFQIFKPALHDAPWVAALKLDTNEIVTGQMLSATALTGAVLSSTEVSAGNDLGEPPLSLPYNILWYDRVRGRDYLLIGDGHGGGQRAIYDGTQWITLASGVTATTMFVNYDDEIYYADRHDLWKHGQWHYSSPVFVGNSGLCYLDGNRDWVQTYYVEFERDMATVDPLVNHNSDIQDEFFFPVFRSWSFSHDGSIRLPHRAYGYFTEVEGEDLVAKAHLGDRVLHIGDAVREDFLVYEVPDSGYEEYVGNEHNFQANSDAVEDCPCACPPLPTPLASF